MHFDPKTLKRRAKPLAFGLAVKLAVVPLLFFLGFALFGGRDLACKVTLLEVAMGPMITGAIIAGDFGLDAELASLMVGVGTPLSVLTVWMWNAVL